MSIQSASWRGGLGAPVLLLIMSACVGVGYGGGGSVGYVGGGYEPSGYDYGGWGGSYRVGPPRRGPPEGGGGHRAPSIPHAPRGGHDSGHDKGHDKDH
jgi:hypothetical protein